MYNGKTTKYTYGHSIHIIHAVGLPLFPAYTTERKKGRAIYVHMLSASLRRQLRSSGAVANWCVNLSLCSCISTRTLWPSRHSAEKLPRKIEASGWVGEKKSCDSSVVPWGNLLRIFFFFSLLPCLSLRPSTSLRWRSRVRLRYLPSASSFEKSPKRSWKF